ncbi:hypothetical protein LAZ67_3001311 [Cordylochernes scorpioides]|uniref:Transposase n=1 Tax=Cordylochernes scorpioides TaxID=51811 RepID=A0ABY6K7U4_9ARAC|nr:hypothetical protein LAZ67_3001311 [Cordylochernes scorpioides]
MLQKAFKDDCISRSQSGKWHKAFKKGREEVADEPLSGRPTTARTDENVDCVHEVLRTDRRLSIQQISDTLHMSTFVVHGIVTEDLQMRKVCAKLVPKVLTQDQKELRVLRCQELLDLIKNEPDFLNSVVTGDESWMFEYDPESKRQSCAWHTKSSPRPKKPRMSKSRIKTMIIVFFDIRGIVHCEFVPQGQTVNSAFYLEVLRRLKRRIPRVRTDIKDTVKLHHDNATSHTATRLKREMKGKHWETVENIQHHVTTFLRSIPVEEFQGAFQAWQTRLRKCIDAGGMYVFGRGIVCEDLVVDNIAFCTLVDFVQYFQSEYQVISCPEAIITSLKVVTLVKRSAPPIPVAPRGPSFLNFTSRSYRSEALVASVLDRLRFLPIKKLDQRTCNKFCVKNEIKWADTFRMLTVAYGEATLDRSNVYRWYKMLSEGREEVNDEERAGRPSTSTTDEKINEVEKLILANRRITVREVAEDLNISIGSCHSIFINDLGMRRVAAKFVPKLLNCDQKQHRMNIANEMLDSVRDDPNLLQRVYGYDVETKAQSSQWKLPHEPRPKKARQVRSNVKVLLTVFLDCRGVVHHEFLPQGRTNKNWLLHHDNAPAHTSLLVRDFLAKNNTLMMPQPPYSPDLAPCDFFLFPKLKRPMKGRRYAKLDEIKTASKEELKRFKK